MATKIRRQRPMSTAEEALFKEKEHRVLTLRLAPYLNEALERYIAAHSSKQRQKKRVIVVALEEFLKAAGFL